jgi:hypothetical protein
VGFLDSTPGIFLGSSVIAAVVAGVFVQRTNDRNIEIDNTTKERTKWRDKIRDRALDVCQACDPQKTQKLKELRLVFSVNLNPQDDEDNGILDTIERLSEGKNTKENLLEFSNRVSLLLKHDWERGKYESKSWVGRIFTRKPLRVKYEEFLKMANSSDFVRILNDRDGQKYLGVSAACGLLLIAISRGSSFPIVNLMAPILWVGFILYGCLWASKFQVLVGILFKKPKKGSYD